MSTTPESQLAEALAESPLYGHIVQAMADAAWGEERSHIGRCGKLSQKLKSWMLERNPVPDDGPPLELLFFGLAVERFGWGEVAEHLAEELGMPSRKYSAPQSRKR